ncbi:hypothetical protein RFI_08860 [Reticulomyxa filosa]|uniref:Uncharacterized protein n=1 Tax=Reticulomyxa filosa TaxID=46433 RepID=X6NSG3_RETFI|nr:hypothetical protein RFI_08860 [Reticulomyxa filosa]|eukprot:ETO28272.1 hypothetical protein RFI_08860 [Reticulomyxa filosa]
MFDKGWKRYLAMAYNLGLFKMLKWGIIGYLIYRYRQYTFPFIKWTVALGCSYWGPIYFEKNLAKFSQNRFEKIYKDFGYLPVPTLVMLIGKTLRVYFYYYYYYHTWFKWWAYRPHRPWLRSIQNFLSTYEPVTDVLGTGYRNGISVRPLFVEHNGHFKCYFKWVVYKKNEGGIYGAITVSCEGDLHSKIMTIKETQLIIDPLMQREALKLSPVKLFIDDEWNAFLISAMDNQNSKPDPLHNKLSSQVLTPEARLKMKHNKLTKIQESDFTPKI